MFQQKSWPDCREGADGPAFASAATERMAGFHTTPEGGCEEFASPPVSQGGSSNCKSFQRTTIVNHERGAVETDKPPSPQITQQPGHGFTRGADALGHLLMSH